MLAVALGLATLFTVEGVVRVAGWGAKPAANAFAEFSAVRPLFVQNGDVFSTAENRRGFFAVDSFAALKQADEFRIFVLGGSTVQGRPYSIPTSFPTFLQIALEHAEPSVNWEVVNCGGVSYASYRLIPLLSECLSYDPDMIIVCTGHNEYLECITYSDVRNSNLAQAFSWADRLHSFRALQQLTQPAEKSPTKSLSVEVDALLDHRGGLEKYSREALHRDVVETEFERNLESLFAACQKQQVPVIFAQPCSNLQDCPPFKSQFDETSSAEHRQRIASRLKEAQSLLESNVSESIRVLQTVTSDDSQFALGWYQLGRALVAAKRYSEADAAFIRARDEDVCPLRMTTGLQHAMMNVVKEKSIPFLNMDELFLASSRHGIVGNRRLVDHVHPSFKGNQEIAIAMVEVLEDLDVVSPLSEWKKPAQQAFDKQLQSLDELYFLRGQRTLNSLRAWSQGRVDEPPELLK